MRGPWLALLAIANVVVAGNNDTGEVQIQGFSPPKASSSPVPKPSPSPAPTLPSYNPGGGYETDKSTCKKEITTITNRYTETCTVTSWATKTSTSTTTCYETITKNQTVTQVSRSFHGTQIEGPWQRATNLSYADPIAEVIFNACEDWFYTDAQHARF